MKTILLVEDEALIAMIEARLLKKNGYEVLTAYNAEKAIETVNEKHIDLILMDIDLGHGKMDGTEAAEIILQDHDIPIVFLSSHTEPEIVERTEKITSYGYIVKNSGDTVLLASLKMAFRLFEANQQIKERENALIGEKERLKEYIEIIENRKRMDEQRNKHLLELYDKMDFPQSDLLDYVLNASLEITSSRFAFTGLINEDESVMTIHKWSTEAMNNCSILDKPVEFPIEKAGIWGDCIRERQPVIINDYNNDTRPTKHGTPEGHVRINRFLCVPVFDGNRIVAVGAVANKILPYDIADADALAFLYDKMWSLLKQQQVDRQLQESEKKFRSIYEESPIGKELYNANGELIEVNRSCLEIFGVTDADQLKGFNLFDDPNVTAEQKRRLRNKEKIRYEVAFDLNKVKQAHLYDTMKSDNIYLDVMITPLVERKENEVRGYLVQVVDITERKVLEKRLEKETFRLTAIVEGTNVGTWEWNVQTGEARLNKQWAAIIGYTLEELEPISIATWQQYAHPDDFKKSEEHLRKHFNGEFEHYEIECRMRHKNGEWIWVLDRGRVATWTEDGKPEWMYGTHQDITERKQTEQAIIESEQRWKSLVENNPDFIAIHDSKGRFLYLNRYAKGFTEEDVIGTCAYDYMSSESKSLFSRKTKECLQTWEVQKFEHRAVGDEGTLRYYENFLVPILEEEPKVIVVSRDVTERIQAEQGVRESEVQLRNIIENSTNIFYSYTVDHQLTFLSPQVESMLGYTVEEAKVKWTELPSDDPVNEIGYRHTIKAIETGERQPPYNLELIKKNGNKLWVEIREHPIVENGETVAIVGSVTDVTESMRVEAELRKSEEKYRLLVKNLAEGVGLVDEEENIIFANSAYCRIFGFSEQELLGKNLKELLPRNEFLKIREETNKRKKGHSSSYETIIKRKDGVERSIKVHATPYKLSGETFAATLGLVEDITEQKALKNDLLIKSRALETSINGIAIGNLRGEITYVNPAFISMWGYDSEEEVIGRSASTFWNEPNKAVEVFQSIAQGENVIRELTAVKKDNTPFTVLLSASQVSDNNGNILAVMSSFVDIGKQNDIQKNYEKANNGTGIP